MQEYLHLQVQCQDDPEHMSQTRMEKVTASNWQAWELSSAQPPCSSTNNKWLNVCWAHHFSFRTLSLGESLSLPSIFLEKKKESSAQSQNWC